MTSAQVHYTPRMQQVYRDQVIPEMMKEFNYKNAMQVPRLKKIVLNMGVGDGGRDAKVIQSAEEDLTAISGQKARRTHARISVSAFKVREGMPVGCSVTMRGGRMYDFLERLICVAIPRIRDFRGLPPKAFDGQGNYNFGLKEHQIFLELDFNKDLLDLGMDVTFVTSAKTDAECKSLLRAFGLPLRDADQGK